MSYVEIATPNDTFLLTELIDVIIKSGVKATTKVQPLQLGTRIGHVGINKVEIGILKRNDASLVIKLRRIDTVENV